MTWTHVIVACKRMWENLLGLLVILLLLKVVFRKKLTIKSIAFGLLEIFKVRCPSDRQKYRRWSLRINNKTELSEAEKKVISGAS